MNFFDFKKSLLDALDCKLITRLSDMCLLKIAAPAREHTPLHCDGIGYRINFIKFFKCLIRFLAGFLVADAIFFTQQHYAIDSLVWKNSNSFFIAQPHFDFNRWH